MKSNNVQRNPEVEKYKKMMLNKRWGEIINLLRVQQDQGIIRGNILRDIKLAASELIKENLPEDIKKYARIIEEQAQLPWIIQQINSARTEEIVTKLYTLDFDFSNTETLLRGMEDLDAQYIEEELKKSVRTYLEGKNPPKNGDIKSAGIKESIALANYYLLKYGSKDNSKIKEMLEWGFSSSQYRQDESLNNCKNKMESASKNTNPFVNPFNPERYEIQREKYLPAAKKIFIFAIASMRGGFDDKQNLEWAEGIFADYEKMYENDISSKNGRMTRFYHSLTHAALQIMPPEIADIIIRIQKLEDSGKKPGNEKDLILADEMIKDLISNNPQIARRVHHSIIHDVVQPCGPGWQKDAIKALKDEKFNLDDLVNKNNKNNKKVLSAPEFEKLGFGNEKTRNFALFAAKIFFPGARGDYDKGKNFGGFSKGAAEFLSVIYAYNKETELDREISLAQQIRMCVSLAATIPFEPNTSFFGESYEKVKILVKGLKKDQKKKLIEEFAKEKLFLQREDFSEDKKLDLAVATMFSEACEMANMDVENFAAKNDILQIYWGSNSVFTEMAGIPKYLSEISAEERIPILITAVKDKRAGIGGRPDGFSYSNANKRVIFHDFKCEFSDLDSPKRGAETTVSMHERAKRNFIKVNELHDFDLIDAVLESSKPGFCLDETKLSEMNEKFRLDLVVKILDVFDKTNKEKQPTKEEIDALKAYVKNKCEPFERKIDKKDRTMVGAAFHIHRERQKLDLKKRKNQNNVPSGATKAKSAEKTSGENGKGNNK